MLVCTNENPCTHLSLVYTYIYIYIHIISEISLQYHRHIDS
jgi:hypothetical protein